MQVIKGGTDVELGRRDLWSFVARLRFDAVVIQKLALLCYQDYLMGEVVAFSLGTRDDALSSRDSADALDMPGKLLPF